MEQRIFHGQIKPVDFSRNLIAHFNKGNLRVQQIGNNDKITVQIATRERQTSGGQTALTVMLQAVEDGVSVRVSKQAWLGVAASLGFTALATLRNPMNLIHRLDDLAQDIESLQLATEVWQVIETTARAIGTGYQLSERLQRSVCGFCNTANPVGEPSCIACGAPLGDEQPKTCKRCGFVIMKNERTCPNCNTRL